jgi:hypothetical protein
MIGALSHQIRGAAILDGSEKITKRGLQAIPLDAAAQFSRPLPATTDR